MSYTSVMNYVELGLRAAALLGIPVVASPVLRWDQAIATRSQILAGEPAHLAHRIRMENIKTDMRADLERTLDDFAARVGVSR